MARCYLTGVQFNLDEGFVFDQRSANRLLRRLRQKIAEVERLVEQLGQVDRVEVFHPIRRQLVNRRQHRLVCQSVAEVLGAVCAEEHLFRSWGEYRQRPPAGRNPSEVSDHGRGSESAHALNRKRLQGAPDARKRPASYTSVCEQVADKAGKRACETPDGVPWDRLLSETPATRGEE